MYSDISLAKNSNLARFVDFIYNTFPNKNRKYHRKYIKNNIYIKIIRLRSSFGSFTLFTNIIIFDNNETHIVISGTYYKQIWIIHKDNQK